MGFEDFREKAKEIIAEAQELTSPIAQLAGGEWSQEISLSESTQAELGDLGPVELKGSLNAALHLTKRPQAPEDLSAIEPDPDETDHAVASAVITAEAGAELNHQQTLAAGAGITLGADAAGRLAVGQHRRYAQTESGLQALRNLLANLRNPYDVASLDALVQGELFGVELSGSGQLTATAGWQAGLVRSFEGTELEKLVPGDLGAVSAGVTAGISVHVGVEGEFRVLVDRSPRDPDQVRVRLYRKRGDFVGAGLSISAKVQLTQAEEFVDSVFSALLELPDDFVAKVRSIQARFDDFQSRLAALSQQVKGQIAAAAGVAENALGLDDLERLRQNLGSLPPALTAPLQPIFDLLDDVQETIGGIEEELTRFVDDAFKTVSDPLETLSAKLFSWLDAYGQARQKAVELVVARAQQGITAELTAGINRTRTSETLLELDFVLNTAGLLCIEAMKGNFAPALERARTPGATGVEIVSGTLKEHTKKERFYSLRLNFFGFSTKVDFQRWNQVDVETDARTGVMTVSGEAGASLTAETNRRLNELSFLFDAYGAFEQQGDTIFTTPETSFRATLTRSAEVRKASLFRDLIPRHLAGARQLRLIGEEREGELAEELLGNPASVYRYDLQLSFPPSSIERMFGLDLAESTKQLRPRVWEWMRQATTILDLPIPHPNGVAPLSATFIEKAIDAAQKQPLVEVPDEVLALRFENRRFQEGASRMIWAYLRNAHFFVEAYLKARQHLQEEAPLEKATKTLSKIAAKAITGPGAIDIVPFDAKYLVFVLAEGLREVEISMTFQRGSVDVTI
jgi:hypothetical protein